jgi:pilus assembly protein CpaB
MKPKTMLLMVVAIGCGLAASVMTSRLIADRNSGAEEKIKVLVTKAKVPAFTLIKEPEKWFVEKELSATGVPKNAYKTLQDVKDLRTFRALGEDVFVLPDDLVSADLHGLAAKLVPGSRAVAIKVDAQSSVAGFVLPSSRVDITWIPQRGGLEPEAVTLLQNMLVLAVDTLDAKEQEKRFAIGSTVTLAAKPEEASRLLLAQSLGDLRLQLRGVGENDKIALKPIKIADLKKMNLDQNPNESGNSEESGSGTPGGSVVPPLPPDSGTPPTTDRRKPEQDPSVTHTMTLIIGESVQRVRFTKDKEGWDAGSNTRKDSDEQPDPRRPAPPKKPAPDAEKYR